jgi:hypothetical protein
MNSSVYCTNFLLSREIGLLLPVVSSFVLAQHYRSRSISICDCSLVMVVVVDGSESSIDWTVRTHAVHNTNSGMKYYAVPHGE